jgi:hypothetical protein
MIPSRNSGAGPGLGLAFSPDGKTVATPVAGTNGDPSTLNLWDVASGREARRIELPAQPGILGFVFAPDGRTLATENMDWTVTLWEVASGKQRVRLGQPIAARRQASAYDYVVIDFNGAASSSAAPVTSVAIAFAPNGRTLAARGPDHSVRVWDVASGKAIGQMEGHNGTVLAVAPSADGKMLASGSSDTTILVWDFTRMRPAPRPQAALLPAKQVESLWADLAGADAARAYRSIERLVTALGQVVPLLRERLRPAEPVEAGKLEQWLADLGSDSFRRRQQATAALEKQGELAMPALSKLLAEQLPLETRRRVEQLLDKMTRRPLTAEQLRLVRAVEVLEQLDTALARQVLTTLARGAVGALATREAQAALDRLKRRSSAPAVVE